MPAPLDSLRERLEDRAELLEATRLRYRALEQMLRAFFWRERIRANLELLREVARVQPEVDAALESIRRRASAECWPPGSEPMLLLGEVSRLREALSRVLARRLALSELPPLLGEALLRLEEQVLAAGPLLGRRTWAQAMELLPRNLPELRAASAAGDVCERLFKRPLPSDALPLTSAEVEELCRVLPLGDSALEALWERLQRYDPTGRVPQVLRERSRRAPQGPPQSGPELLLHAAFWHEVAHSRLATLLESRLVPLVPRPEEHLELMAWLVARESSPEAHLPASEVLGEGRAGLLELAAELAALERPRSAGGEQGGWSRLEAAARRARAETGADVERLREALRLFIRLRGQGRTPARLFSPLRARIPSGPGAGDVEDLPSLVGLARAAAWGEASTPGGPGGGVRV